MAVEMISGPISTKECFAGSEDQTRDHLHTRRTGGSDRATGPACYKLKQSTALQHCKSTCYPPIKDDKCL